MIKLIASDRTAPLIGHEIPFDLAPLRPPAPPGLTSFVTGRPSCWLTPLREQTDFDSYAIQPNGAVGVPPVKWRTKTDYCLCEKSL